MNTIRVSMTKQCLLCVVNHIIYFLSMLCMLKKILVSPEYLTSKACHELHIIQSTASRHFVGVLDN